MPVLVPRMTFGQRCREVSRRWRLLVRLAAATSLAYFVSTHLLGHEQAFFAPVAAVIVLLAGVGLRQRLLLELVLGVAVGVLVGEILILGIGRGAWQLALIVVLTTTTAVFAGLKGVSLTQAANSGVLLAAVVPAAGADNPAMTRFTDALIGGVCALAMIALVPRNVTRDVDRQVRPLLDDLEAVLSAVAQAVRTSDAVVAQDALARARGLQAEVTTALNTAASVQEVATMSPLRWRHRSEVDRYASLLIDIDYAIRDARVLARRVATMVRLGEDCGTAMADAIDVLAVGVRLFEADLDRPENYAHAQEQLIDSVRAAVAAATADMTLNRAAVATQIRSLAADVLLASGLDQGDLDVRLDF